MLVHDILKNASSSFPERTALVYKQERYTYSQLQKMVDQFALALIKSGIKKGDRVATMLRNTPFTVVVYFATLKIGAIEVALNVTADSSDFIVEKLNDCGAKCLISHVHFLKTIIHAQEQIIALESIYHIGELEGVNEFNFNLIAFESVLSEENVSVPSVPVDQDHVATIAYSSGTTGVPKGVILTHFNLMSVSEVVLKDLDDDNERCLMLIPLYHTFGKQILNSRFMRGVTLVLVENIAFPEVILHAIENEKVTGIVGVPTIYKIMLKLINSRTDFDGTSLKYISSGGAKISVNQIEELWEKFPQIRIFSGYGLTETCGRGTVISFIREDQGKEILDSCGKPPFEMKLVNEQGKECAAREVGQVLFKGPNVMQGYWEKQQETAEVLRNGWLLTGDLGTVDEEGNLYLLGRKKDIIKTGGELISPAEIEKVIERHLKVREAAVVGIPDDLLGERMKAFVVLNRGEVLEVHDIKEWCSRYLPPVKIPSVVQFCAKLPKATLDKVKKAELREN